MEPSSRSRPVPAELPTAADLGIGAYVDPSGRVRGVADVLCDETGRLGALSYVVPDGLEVRLGDAVHVPFGRRELHGVVLGAGKPDRATREVLRVYGKRVSAAEIHLAEDLAARHFCDLVQVATRFSPRSGRGSDPLQAGPLVLAPSSEPIHYPRTADTHRRRFLLRAPLVDPARLAAEEAVRLASASDSAQVLVLCPTVDLLESVLSHFASGAARVDTQAPEGAWRGLCDGGVTVAVGTRSAALYSASDLAGIVVVEEDHPGHLEATQPYTHARDVALARSWALDVPLVLIGANPSPAAIGSNKDRWPKVVPVGTKADWPRVKVVERRDFRPDERLVPPPLSAALARAAQEDVVPLVLAERKKASRRCVRCGVERPCDRCTSSTCRHLEEVPCEKCQTTEVRMVGWDSKRLTQLLGKGVKPVQAKSLADVSDAGVVVVFDIDAALKAPGFSPESMAAHLLLVAARAAGRGGLLVVCTSQSDHPLIQDLCVRRDQRAVALRAWELAKDEELPPFKRLVTVRTGQDRRPNVNRWPRKVYGPRKVGDEFEVLVKIDDVELPGLAPHLERLRRGGKVRVTVA